MARASSIAKIAEPLKTIPTDKLIDELKDLQTKTSAGAIVVGLPRNLSGEDTNKTKWVREWVKNAKVQSLSPMYWFDEALTSEHSSGTENDHASAAAIILQDFINTPKADRVAC